MIELEYRVTDEKQRAELFNCFRERRRVGVITFQGEDIPVYIKTIEDVDDGESIFTLATERPARLTIKMTD